MPPFKNSGYAPAFIVVFTQGTQGILKTFDTFYILGMFEFEFDKQDQIKNIAAKTKVRKRRKGQPYRKPIIFKICDPFSPELTGKLSLAILHSVLDEMMMLY